MKIQYGATELDINPAASPTITFEHTEGDNEPNIIKEVWDIEGTIKNQGWSNLIAEWNTIVAVLRVPAQDFKLKTRAGATVYELKAIDCINGPTCKDISVTEKREAFLVTNIKFRLTIEATYQNPSASPVDFVRRRLNLSYNFDSLGFLEMAERGEAESKSAITKPPDPFLSPQEEAFTQESRFDLSESRLKCTYSYTFRERKVQLPEELRDLIGEFSLSIEETNSEDFLYKTIRVAGRCRIRQEPTDKNVWDQSNLLIKTPAVRPPAGEVAENFIPVNDLESIGGGTKVAQLVEWIENNLVGEGVKIRSKSITADVFDQSVSFAFDLLKEAYGNLASFDYSISIRESAVRISEVNIFAYKPVLQRLGWTSMEIIERGSVVVFGGRPVHPEPVWLDRCTSRIVEYPKPSYVPGQELLECPMTFSFTYKDVDFDLGDLSQIVNNRVERYGLPQLGL